MSGRVADKIEDAKSMVIKLREELDRLIADHEKRGVAVRRAPRPEDDPDGKKST